jgi:hypothetical protein
VNAGLLLIYQKKSALEAKKKEPNRKKNDLARMVHPTRFELISSVPETEILSIELRVHLGLAPVTGCKYSPYFDLMSIIQKKISITDYFFSGTIIVLIMPSLPRL